MNTQLVDSSVFPLARIASEPNGEVRWCGLCGTGFSLGSTDWCMTAKHVLEGGAANIGGVFRDGTGFISREISEIHSHPNEDIAIFRIQSKSFSSWFKWEIGHCHPAADYVAAGYPDFLLFDHGRVDPQTNRLSPRPELVISIGHVRRRMSYSLPSIVGSSFIELSEVIGEGASGGPVFTRTPKGLKFIGVYVGAHQKLNTDGNIQIPPVGIAVRADDFIEWAPEVLEGRKISDLLG